MNGSLKSSFDNISIDRKNRFLSEKMSWCDKSTANAVLETFQTLTLPLPQATGITDGHCDELIFLTRYGLTLRIESIYNIRRDWHAAVAPITPWTARPIGRIPAGNEAVVGLYPGADLRDCTKEDLAYLKRNLGLLEVEFHDCFPQNIGFAAYKTGRFPEGVPIVIDTDAVKLFDGRTQILRSALDKEGLEILAAEQTMYDPLRAAFAQCWRQPQEIRRFWDLCEQYVQEGKLVPGWTNYMQLHQVSGAHDGARAAAIAGEAYEKDLCVVHGKPRSNTPGL